jgi:CBS domain containing-hemolysin-like protein
MQETSFKDNRIFALSSVLITIFTIVNLDITRPVFANDLIQSFGLTKSSANIITYLILHIVLSSSIFLVLSHLLDELGNIWEK